MGKLLLTILSVLSAFFGYSTILIVDNNPNHPGGFTELLPAIAAASNGDTIYIQGSNSVYLPGGGTIAVDKRLVFIGTGHNPQKQANLVSRIGGTFDFRVGSSRSVIMGLTGNGNGINIGISSNSVDSLLISNNYIASLTIRGSHHIIEGNIKQANYFIFYTGSNIIVRNNVISGGVDGASDPTIEFMNNVFLTNGQLFTNTSNVMVRNNIFLKASPIGTSSVTFLNNITYLTTDTLPTPGNTGSGNLNNTDPLFVNVPSFATSFSYGYDFHLQSGSAGKNAGTDGTDIGLYGGLGNFKTGGEPAIPIIREFSIMNPIVPVGGDIVIKVAAEVQD